MRMNFTSSEIRTAEKIARRDSADSLKLFAVLHGSFLINPGIN